MCHWLVDFFTSKFAVEWVEEKRFFVQIFKVALKNYAPNPSCPSLFAYPWKKLKRTFCILKKIYYICIHKIINTYYHEICSNYLKSFNNYTPCVVIHTYINVFVCILLRAPERRQFRTRDGYLPLCRYI